MVPTAIVTAVHELGWLALLVTADSTLATEPGELLQLLDGLIVPDWRPSADRNADFAQRLGESAESRGLPVLRLPASLLTHESTVADYARAMENLLTPGARVASA
jgi:hypothetical protein